jgi:hypothetical protein
MTIQLVLQIRTRDDDYKVVIERKVYDVTGAGRLDGSSDFETSDFGSGMFSMTGVRSPLEEAQETYNWASRLGKYCFFLQQHLSLIFVNLCIIFDLELEAILCL